jgi:hypothetical protein
VATRLANGAAKGGTTEPSRVVVKATAADPEPDAVKNTLEGPAAFLEIADAATVMFAYPVVFVQNT